MLTKKTTAQHLSPIFQLLRASSPKRFLMLYWKNYFTLEKCYIGTTIQLRYIITGLLSKNIYWH